MGRRLLAAVLIALLALPFGSCTYLPMGGTRDSLLVAPRLSKRQTAVREALEATLNLSDIIYKYPQSGEYRSPFVFYDLNGDGVEEVVVFYAYRSDSAAIRFKVLAEREDGSWYGVHDFPGTGEEDQIDSIHFAPLLEQTRVCMVIGWKNPRMQQGTLGAYSYGSDGFHLEISQPYVAWDMADFNGDGLSEIVAVFQMGQERRNHLALLTQGYDGGLWRADDIPLAGSAVEVRQILRGRLWDGRMAVYLDELDTGARLVTEVVRVEADSLTPLVSEEEMSNFSSTIRAEGIYCADLDGDGAVEIPAQPDDENLRRPGTPSLTEFMRLTGDGFETVYFCYINEDDGYLIFLPEDWVGMVSVERQPEVREWRFYKSDPKDEESTIDLLYIRVYATQDYQDKFTESYTPLEQRGMLRYYAYIPPARAGEESDSLAVHMSQVKEMFQLYESVK